MMLTIIKFIYILEVRLILRRVVLYMSSEHRLNNDIKVVDVRLVGSEGEAIGVVSIREALYRADEEGLDLVEIAPNAKPPVCRIMDYGKFKYQEQKKSHDAKMKQHRVETKEIHIRPSTDEGDYKVKVRKVREFLTQGDKCRIVVRFMGREISHLNFGTELMERIVAELSDIGFLENKSVLENKKLSMLLAPKCK